MKNFITIKGRRIGPDFSPFVIAEVGINHEGNIEKAKQMVWDAANFGAECVKFQCHVVEDEMAEPIARLIIPDLPINTEKDSIWDIMKRCSFSEEEDRELKEYTESLGLIYLSTPFSRAAADRLQRMKVEAYKIGSGECNNYPLIEHVASFGKPIILSTGMNNLASIRPAVKILRKYRTPYALLHCVSMYPTPYDKVRLGSLLDLKKAFPDAVLGLSDHSIGIYTCLGAVSLGASILEKHFTSDKQWPGPDVSISIDPSELYELVIGSRAIYSALGGEKQILLEEQPTIDFAYSCVVSIRDIKKGDRFTKKNIWVKRPGTGEIKAVDYKKIIGKKASRNILKDEQIRRCDLS
ncbi:MAG: N-acetylneuraminate synthase family protein [Candidatus Parcubacteria bacterium]|nr:N-acetylneuraminate synthase family protein [Candidatus Parcubacteria bacterium]